MCIHVTKMFQGKSGIAGPPGDRGNPGQRVSNVECGHGSCGIYFKQTNMCLSNLLLCFQGPKGAKGQAGDAGQIGIHGDPVCITYTYIYIQSDFS